MPLSISQAPNFQQIREEAGPFTQEGLQAVYFALINQGQIHDRAELTSGGQFAPKELILDLNSQQDDLDLKGASLITLKGVGSYDITGARSPNPGESRLVLWLNVGAGTVTLKDADGSSLASNQFVLGGDVPLAPLAASILVYANSKYYKVL